MVRRFSHVVPRESIAAVRSALQAASPAPVPDADGSPRLLPADHPAVAELGPVLVSAVRAHPEVEPSLYPAAFSLPAFYRFAPSTSAGPQLAGALASPGPKLRVDLAILLWLSGKAAYDGRDVVLDEGGAVTRWSAEGGEIVAFPAGARWEVEPVTRGELLLCLLLVQSLVAGEVERRILFDFNCALQEFERRRASSAHARTMRRVYNGLVRMWAELPRQSSAP